MLKIGICDDDLRILNQIEDLIKFFEHQRNHSFEISQFSSGEELCKRAELDQLDIVFLDIEMEAMNGIQTAEYIREYNMHAKIIYVSKYEQYWRELFHVNTFAFIDKPIEAERFFQVLQMACDEIRSYNDMFYFRSGKVHQGILLRKILYFESQAHLVLIHHLSQPEISYYDKLSEVWRKLSRLDFIQVGKSYLVNLLHVESLHGNEVTMINSDKIPISRQYKNAVLAAYCKYRERRSRQ